MNVSRWQHSLLLWGGWILFAIFLKFGPTFIEAKLSHFVMHSAGSSLRFLDELHRWVRANPDEKTVQTPREMKKNSSISTLQKQNRDLTAIIVMLQAENSHLKTIPEISFKDEGQVLRKTSALPANVLGFQRDGISKNQRLLVSLGERHGLAGEELILNGDGVLIDQGTHADLTTDQVVSLGRSLFGRIIEVGRWTSLVQPITHPEFRTAVRLVRVSEFGTATGAEGILKGTGDGCQMLEVVGTEPVAVGDLVYTNPHVSPTSVPIYCGRVANASINPNDSHWTILVTPPNTTDATPIDLSVLKVELNVPDSQDGALH